MKTNTHIFSAIFVIVFGLLHLQPLSLVQNVKNETCCAKKSKCSSQKPTESDDGCQSKGCNPFVPCSMGTCCYLVENFAEHNYSSVAKKQKTPLFNDNTVQSALTECWHPPESFS